MGLGRLTIRSGLLLAKQSESEAGGSICQWAGDRAARSGTRHVGQCR
jgi:hypothetical protein